MQESFGKAGALSVRTSRKVISELLQKRKDRTTKEPELILERDPSRVCSCLSGNTLEPLDTGLFG